MGLDFPNPVGLAAGLAWPLALGLWASALVRVLPAIVTVPFTVTRPLPIHSVTGG